jgi:hypothetical protein
MIGYQSVRVSQNLDWFTQRREMVDFGPAKASLGQLQRGVPAVTEQKPTIRLSYSCERLAVGPESSKIAPTMTKTIPTHWALVGRSSKRA